MRRTITLCLLSCLIGNVTLAARAATRRGNPVDIPNAMVPEGGLSAEQMDNLLAPIALYPDPLLAQVLPASTFVEAGSTWASSGSTTTILRRRSEEHTSELQSLAYLVCRLLLEKKK